MDPATIFLLVNSSGKKNASLNFLQISLWNLKLKRSGLPKKFGKDLCTCTRAQSKSVHMHINVPLKMCAHTFMRGAHMFVLVVHSYVMTLSLKFRKDPSFCWRDMHKITLNMHTRGINTCTKFWYTRVHTFASLARVCAQIFTKHFFVINYSVMSLKFQVS